jgi:hypothetical protein
VGLRRSLQPRQQRIEHVQASQAQRQRRALGEQVVAAVERLEREGLGGLTVQLEQRVEAGREDVGLRLADANPQAQQRAAQRRVAPRREPAGTRRPAGRRRVGQEVRQDQRRVGAPEIHQRQRRAGPQRRGGVHRRAPARLHLAGPRRAQVERVGGDLQPGQRLDDPGLRRAGGVALDRLHLGGRVGRRLADRAQGVQGLLGRVVAPWREATAPAAQNLSDLPAARPRAGARRLDI